MSTQIDSNPDFDFDGKDDTKFLLHQYAHCVPTSDDPGLRNLAEHLIQIDSQMHSPKGRVSGFAKRAVLVPASVPPFQTVDEKQRREIDVKLWVRKSPNPNCIVAIRTLLVSSDLSNIYISAVTKERSIAG